MNKGIIVIEVPDCCEDCPCCHANDYNYRCQVNGKRVDWESKPDWCPVRPIPAALVGANLPELCVAGASGKSRPGS